MASQEEWQNLNKYLPIEETAAGFNQSTMDRIKTEAKTFGQIEALMDSRTSCKTNSINT